MHKKPEWFYTFLKICYCESTILFLQLANFPAAHQHIVNLKEIKLCG
jgi:hypothetical protein